MSFNQLPQNQLEPQPFRKILATLVRVPPMNLDVAGALLFIISLIVYPAGSFFNLLFAAIAAYIVYGAVKRAEVYTLLQDAHTMPDEIRTATQHFFVKPTAFDVVKQSFRGVINIIFLVAIFINLLSIFGALTLSPVPVMSVVSSSLLVVVYLLFMISNGYTRAQMVQAYGKAPGLFG